MIFSPQFIQSSIIYTDDEKLSSKFETSSLNGASTRSIHLLLCKLASSDKHIMISVSDDRLIFHLIRPFMTFGKLISFLMGHDSYMGFYARKKIFCSIQMSAEG